MQRYLGPKVLIIDEMDYQRKEQLYKSISNLYSCSFKISKTIFTINLKINNTRLLDNLFEHIQVGNFYRGTVEINQTLVAHAAHFPG